MTLTKANLTALKVETLAKLYLESKAAEISDRTIAQLCDWLMGEFQQLPLNLQFSDYMRYENAEEMFADIKQGQLWVSAESYDSSVYPNPIYGFIFQGMHDYDHYLTDSEFSLEGEIVAYKFTAKRAPSLDIQKILYSEIVLRSAAYLYLGHMAAPKIVFP
ncbi:transposase [Tychonema sp. LEGE 07199]|uniref:transposase n=1 Tax=unclassified Tychonema TaxID=2642144 RepID=UPI001881E4A4|nr:MULTISPECIES: transposase [unclassified Tychonema]MBE9119638.1 transposase [Tychonema sp. LEGE 07199]MBE9132233.1 transposase [Tychonema sp. LEGE 07196]